jgi:hypothetical protein
LEKEDEEYLDEMLQQVPEENRPYIAEEAYDNFMKAKQSKAFLDERASARKNITTSQTPIDRNEANLMVKTSQFTDIIRDLSLRNGIQDVTSTDDDNILKSVFEQRPELESAYLDFVNGKTTIEDVLSAIKQEKTVKVMPKRQQAILNTAR